MSERIARRYLPARNPDGAFLPGVPLRDITAAEWESIPEWLKRSIDAWEAYRAPKDAPPAAPAEQED